jgi:3-phosphoshikimate 1-carboxyvinyltransferase
MLKEIRGFPKGVVTPPPSKSLSHRAVICAALADGESVIENLGCSDDIEATLSCVKILLGAGFEPGGAFGRDGQGKSSEGEGVPVGCGESGSTLRFMLPVAALGSRRVVFSGKGRLFARPLDIYEGIFRAAGATYEQGAGRVAVKGPLRSGEYVVPGDVSSQFVSGLLLALPLLDGDSSIRLSSPLESSGYVDMTIDVMRRFGVEVWREGPLYLVKGGQRYRPARYRVEADYSQAAFFLVSAALGRGVEVSGLDSESIQGDRAILSVLGDAGAEILWKEGAVSVRAGKLSPLTVDAREIPDLVPPIAVLCCFCDGTSRIANAGRLRLKESDRLHALAAELGGLGARVKEGVDYLEITGSESLAGGDADACGDHRIAMALAVAAIRCKGRVRLSGWRSVAKSYPGFWRDFEGDGSGIRYHHKGGGPNDNHTETQRH